MMMTRYRDFDAWEAERKAEPVTFRIRGADYELPATLPAIIPIRAMRLQRQYGSDAAIPPAEMMELALSLFGDAQVERLLGSGVDVEALSEIVGWAMEVYTGAPSGEATAPETAPGQTGSSGTGA
jgi:hypothetical protein